MKKLYRKGTVHPSPPPPAIVSDDCLSFLPAAIFSLAAGLSPEDREVLAYLLLCNTNSSSSSSSSAKKSPSSSSSSSSSGSRDHAPRFGCDCFRCYTTYWVRWDSSPNRQLIHEIIEAFEDHHHRHGHNQLQGKGKKAKNKERRNNNNNNDNRKKGKNMSDINNTESKKRSESASSGAGNESSAELNADGREGSDGREVEEGSNVKRLVSFIGERIWGVWG